jgi:alpha(1,3/1,4) fucosyltransferase
MGRGLKPMDVDVYFDPPTHHLYGNRLFDRESNPYAGDNILAPYAAVCDRLCSYGIKVQTADFLPATNVGRRSLLISFGTPDRLVAQSVKKYRALALRSDVTLSAFFAMECPIVEPTMYRALPRLEQCFQRIFSWSDSSSLLKFTPKPVRLEHFCWPQYFDAVHEHLWSNQERKFLVMTNANKLPRLYVDKLSTARLRAKFRDFAELRAFLHGLPQPGLQQYQEAARAYLASDRFKPFRLEAFAELIAGIVAADAGIAS